MSERDDNDGQGRECKKTEEWRWGDEYGDETDDGDEED